MCSATFCFNSTNQCYQKWIYKPKLDKLGITMGFLPVFSFEPDWFHHRLCFQVALLVSLWVRCLHWMLQLLRPQEHTTRLMLVRNDANITMVGDACCIPDVFVQFWTCKGFFLCIWRRSMWFEFPAFPGAFARQAARTALHAHMQKKLSGPKSWGMCPEWPRTTAQSGSRRTWRPNSAEISRCANRMRDVCVQRQKKRLIPWAWDQSWYLGNLGDGDGAKPTTPPKLDRINMGVSGLDWFWCHDALEQCWLCSSEMSLGHSQSERAKRCKNGN